MTGLFSRISVRLREARRRIKASEGTVARAQSDAPADTIGVLLVHGIGDQGRFQFLDETVRSLAVALTHAETSPPRVSVSLRASGGSLVGAAAQTLREDGGPAAEIVVRRGDGTIVRFAIHEAWWGDVIEPAALFRPFFFFAWGLAMWAVPFKSREAKPDPGSIREEPEPAEGRGFGSTLSVRVRLFFVSYLILAVGVGTSAICALLRAVTRQNVPDPMLLAISYMSDIKLYTQATPRRAAQAVPLDWAGQHARFAIRARAIRGLANMAVRGYRQWWVMGHSMGSVVAFSALSTPDALFSRYLDEESWDALKENGYDRQVPSEGIGTTAVVEPAWLPRGAGIDRAKLLANFEGLVTFGSPLDKFAYIWPATVSSASDQAPLKGKRWLNVHDATDPVAGPLDAFAKVGDAIAEFQPINLGYAASPWPLYSHLRYLITPEKERGKTFAASLVRWWLAIYDAPASTAKHPDISGSRWQASHPCRWRLRQTLSWAFWIAVAGVAPIATAVGLKVLLIPLVNRLLCGGECEWWVGLSWWSTVVTMALGITLVAIIVVTLAGAIAWVFADDSDLREPDRAGLTGGGGPHAQSPVADESRMN